MKCVRCRAHAEVQLRAHNAAYCRPCFLFVFRRQVERAIDSERMFVPGERLLVAVLDDLAVREEEVAADHHRRPGQDAEVGEELRNPPAPGDLDRTAVGSQVDAHQKKVPVAPRRNTLKAAALP